MNENHAIYICAIITTKIFCRQPLAGPTSTRPEKVNFFFQFFNLCSLLDACAIDILHLTYWSSLKYALSLEEELKIDEVRCVFGRPL